MTTLVFIFNFVKTKLELLMMRKSKKYIIRDMIVRRRKHIFYLNNELNESNRIGILLNEKREIPFSLSTMYA